MTSVLNNLVAKERFVLTSIFTVIFGLLLFDVYEDLSSGASLAHVGFEAFILGLSVLGIMLLWSIFFIQRRSIAQLSLNLDQARVDLGQYKQKSRKFAEGLSQTIEEQLQSWSLSRAEKEIALLMLKGLSNREIGDIRGTSEATIRQQGSSIFQKSNLSGRSELSAFFLEDLLIIQS
ncbi:MAG: response regulator transcription factor [Halobacteriovoraceae bacterium]|jgi:DNA-binding CsgD family transcriptional regulator|nr:response regulator transcription factor [Halobacteriovoraceae bacterium]MBT5093789.1 response regulator transcription factor [Halobacteriovoraceae bacterium]